MSIQNRDESQVTNGQDPLKIAVPKSAARVLDAFERLLENVSVIPYASIQSALIETGPSPRRLDPLELKVDLLALTNGLLPSVPPPAWEPLPKIYASIQQYGDQQAALAAAKVKEEQLNELALFHSGERATAVAQVLSRVFPSITQVNVTNESDVECLGGAIAWTASGAQFEIAAQGKLSPANVWLTNNVEWLLPHDARLWQHFSRCLQTETRPIIVARKIAFSVFPLFKRLGATGLQLHQLYFAEQSVNDRLWEQAMGHLRHVKPADSVVQHEVVTNRLPMHAEEQAELDKDAKDAIEKGLRLGLATEQTAGPITLRKWANIVDLPLPTPWKAQITRYARWRSAFPIQLRF
jgi:hypothetical protein